MKITKNDYLKANKKAMREVYLKDNFSANLCNKIHSTKKTYNRKNVNSDIYNSEQ